MNKLQVLWVAWSSSLITSLLSHKRFDNNVRIKVWKPISSLSSGPKWKPDMPRPGSLIWILTTYSISFYPNEMVFFLLIAFSFLCVIFFIFFLMFVYHYKPAEVGSMMLTFICDVLSLLPEQEFLGGCVDCTWSEPTFWLQVLQAWPKKFAGTKTTCKFFLRSGELWRGTFSLPVIQNCLTSVNNKFQI